MNKKSNTALSIKHCNPPKNDTDYEGMYWYLGWLMAKHGINSDSLHYLEVLYKRGELAAAGTGLFSAAVHLADNAESISEPHQADPDEHVVNNEDFQELLLAIQKFREARSAKKR